MGWAGLIFFILVIGVIYEIGDKGEKIKKDKDTKEQKEIERKRIDDQIENERLCIINENIKLTNQTKIDNVLEGSLSNKQVLFSLASISLGVILIVFLFKFIYMT